MAITRFLALKFKEEHAGTDEKAKQTREEVYNQHLDLYRTRPYVQDVQSSIGSQTSGLAHGYHYAFVVKFESEEKVKYYADEDKEHLEFKKKYGPFTETLFAWEFPPQS